MFFSLQNGSLGSSYAVCLSVTRPTSEEDAETVRRLISDWPVSEEERVKVKSILNIADCRIGVSDDAILAEAPGDASVVVIDINNPEDGWVYIPWG